VSEKKLEPLSSKNAKIVKRLVSEKAVSLKELLKKRPHFAKVKAGVVNCIKLEQWFEDFEASVAIEKNKQKMKEEKMWNAHQQTIDKLVELKFKHGALVALLRDLRNDFPNPELVYNKRYQTEVIKNPQVFASLCWKWLKRLPLNNK